MSKVKNPERKCRICGNRCEKQMRYCKLCARAIKEDRERAARANAWLKQHGFEEEPFHWSKEETPCL